MPSIMSLAQEHLVLAEANLGETFERLREFFGNGTLALLRLIKVAKQVLRHCRISAYMFPFPC